MIKNKRVLVSPLDWGLGHATRCVPIIEELIRNENQVFLAASGNARHFLEKHFPTLEMIPCQDLNIRYSGKTSMAVMMMLQLPKIIWHTWSEHKWLKKIVKEKNLDVVISDNRYGLWNKKVRSIFITHQLMIKFPEKWNFMEPVVHRLLKSVFTKYNEIWIPDILGEKNLSGDLSHLYPAPANAKYIGWLSRFKAGKFQKEESSEIPDVCVILSGPEPSRSELAELVIDQLKSLPVSAVILGGLPGNNDSPTFINEINFIPHLDDDRMQKLIEGSKIIFCRSGYSSIMDLQVLEKRAVLIPTPGQTEQIYLGIHLASHELFRVVNQQELVLKDILTEERIINVSKGDPKKLPSDVTV